MSSFEIIAVLLAGCAAGTINAIVGSGSLVTFPTLLVLGFPPLVANMSNNVGLLPGGLAGAYGYRRELAGQGVVLRRTVPPALLGGAVGALLLLVLPASVFGAVVPVLVLFGIALVAVGPRLQKAAADRAARRGQGPGDIRTAHPVAVPLLVFLTGVYGGYFGAAQGIIFVGLMSVLLPIPLQNVNAVKNVTTPLVNLIAAVFFVALRFGEIDWRVAALIGVGSAVGGFLGSHIGRRLPAPVLRGVIIVIGLVALARMTLWS